MGDIKPRSDAVLKTLPRERQDQIIEWCDTPKSETCSGGLKYAWEQLAADGLKLLGWRRQLSEFYKWYHSREFYESASQDSEQQKELMLKFDPSDVERAEAFGDFCFLQKAAKAQDPKTYVAIRNVRQTDKMLNLKAKGDKVKERQKDRSLEQKDKEIAIAIRRAETAERKMKQAATEVQKLRDPKAQLTDADREAIVSKVDEILGLKKS